MDMRKKTCLASSLLVTLGLLCSLGATPVLADDATLPVDASLEERLAYGKAHPDEDLGTYTAGSSMEGESLVAALDTRSANGSPYWGGTNASKTFYNGYDEVFASPALKVIDVSEWQGTIDWSKVKNSGVDAVILRFAHSTSHFDKQFERNLSEVRRLGIPFGLYIFSTAQNSNDATSEAYFTQQIVSKYGLYDLSLPIFYDLEKFYDSNGNAISPNSASAYEGIVNAYFNTLSGFGINNVSIYSGRWYTDTYLKAASVRPRVSWIAEYGPKLKTSFSCAGQYGWQYTSSEHLDGITANTVDMSAFSSADFVNVLNMPDFSLADGTYYIDSIAKDSSSVTVAADTSLSLYGAQGTANQRFNLESDGSGAYRIKSESTGLYLSVAGDSAQSGSLVTQAAYAQDEHQLWHVRVADSGFYIQSALGNWVLDFNGGSTADGTSVRIWAPNKSNAQRFTFASASTVKTDTAFAIKSALNPQLVMDIYGGSSDNLARLQIYNANNSQAQMFSFKQVGNGLYEIVNVNSDKPFEAQGGSVSNGGAISQYASNGTCAQHWSVIDHGNGEYSFINSKSGKAVDVPGGNGVSGSALQIYTYNGSDAQKWTLAPARTVRQELNDLAASGKGLVKEGVEYAIGSVSERQVFDIAGGSINSGANLQLYASNATKAQRWTFSYDKNGYVTITNVKSGKVLDVSAGSKKAGANVQQYASNGSWAQKWILVDCGDGSFKICSAIRTGFVLDLAGGSSANGANVQVYDDNGTAAQRFRLYTAGEVSKAQTIESQTAVVAASDGRVFDVTGGSMDSGAALQLYSANGTIAQSFGFEYEAEKGLYAIKSAKSYRYLYAQDGDIVPGAAVKQGSVSPSSPNYSWGIEDAGNGSYRIVNAANGCVLGANASGKLVTVARGDARELVVTFASSDFKCLRSEQDADAAAHVSDLADGEYLLSSSKNYSFVLDVSSGSKENSANIQLYKSNMSNAQRWIVSHDDKGYVTFTNAGSNKVIDVAGGNASAGTNIAQYASNGTFAQKWIVAKQSDGTYLVESALKPGFYLGSRGGSASNGVNVELSTNESSSSFALLSTSPSVAKCEDFLPKGYFTLSPACSSTGKVIDIASGSSSNGANVQLYNSNGTLAQLFSFEYHDGYYVIRNVKSQKVLDVAGGDLIPGANVQQWDGDSINNNQLFAVIDNSDGTFSFVNKATGLVLNIANGSDSARANVNGSLSNGLAAQKFTLHQVTEFLSEGASTLESTTASKVLDVASGSTEDGAAIQLYAANDTLAQKWYVSKVAGLDNTYEIECIGSAKVLSLTDEGKLVQLTSSGADSQRWHSALSGGKIALQNAATGQYLCASGSSATLGMVDSLELPGVRFNVKSVGVLSEGSYTIQLMSNRSQVFDVSGGSATAGASVGFFGSNGTAAQIWDVRKNSDGTYEISSAKSCKPLDIKNANQTVGNGVQIWTRNEGAAQKWKLVYNRGEGYTIQSTSGLVLASINGSLALCEDSGSANQRFAFEKATYIPPTLTGVQWKGCAHYSSTRYGEDWSVIVIHISECTSLSQIDNTFWGTREASAHYGVAPGQIHQYVGLNDTAWAVGNWEWNKRSVSIEHVGTTANSPSYATLDTSAQLMAALARSKGWRHLTMGDNVGIHKWYSSTSCPAGTDVNWLVAKANQYLGN